MRKPPSLSSLLTTLGAMTICALLTSLPFAHRPTLQAKVTAQHIQTLRKDMPACCLAGGFRTLCRCGCIFWQLFCSFAFCSFLAAGHWLLTPSIAFWHKVLALHDALPMLRVLLLSQALALMRRLPRVPDLVTPAVGGPEVRRVLSSPCRPSRGVKAAHRHPTGCFLRLRLLPE